MFLSLLRDQEPSNYSKLKRKVLLQMVHEEIVKKIPKTRNSCPRTDYSQSPWAVMLAKGHCQDLEHKDGRYFRRRFRVPYPLFTRIVELCKHYDWFPESHRSAPLELKLLATFRRLGRGGCFDNLYDSCGIDQETLRVFYLQFCHHFSSTLWDAYVRPPASAAEIDKVTSVYKRLGFPGAIGSTDSTHVRWEKCPAHLRASCKGKEGYPCLRYEITVDHFRRIHACTESHVGSRNDKTIVKYDSHVMNIHENGLYGDNVYYLYNENGELEENRGLWLITDGGYHKWKCMSSPMKFTHDMNSSHWSCSLESVRKDVECVNGNLKIRFRELKYPIELHDKDDIDAVFFTCCVLHNMLLEYDGYDRQWDEAAAAAEDPDADYDEEYDMLQVQQHRAEQRVRIHADPIHPNEDDNVEAEVEPDYFTLRTKLITHYTQAYAKREIEWLTSA